MYKISFCIPVFNNIDSVKCIVEKLLALKNGLIQIVITDDCSTDSTLEYLENINAGCLKVKQNSCRLGAKLNWYEALSYGDGQYLYLVMGRDGLEYNKIGKLLQYLDTAEEEKIDLVMDRRCNGNYMILEGIDAYKYFLRQEHPTGTIFSRAAFNDIINARSFFEKNMAYPEMYIKNEILKNHAKGMIINSGVFSYKVNVDKVTVQSQFEHKRNEGDLFYYPARREEQYCEIIKMSEKMLEEYCAKDINEFYTQKIKELFEEVSFGYKTWREDFEIAKHYGVEKKYIDEQTMIDNINHAYDVVQKTTNRLFEKCEDILKVFIEEYYERILNKEEEFKIKYRYETIIKILERYILSKKRGFDYSDYLSEKGINKIIIYGYGDVGRVIYEDLKKSKVEVLYAVDRNSSSIYSDLSIYNPTESLSGNPDLAIICVIGEKEVAKIKQYLTKSFGDIKITTAEEFVYGII